MMTGTQPSMGLIKTCVDVNIQDKVQGAPIHLAANERHTEALVGLIKAGADVNIQDGDKRAPIHLAAN